MLRICTYNVCMHITGFHQNLCHNLKLERMNEIIDWILANNYDIVCLQEVFHEECHKMIITKLSHIYKIILPIKHYYGIYNSGLLTLCKLPILFNKETLYENQGNLIANIFKRSMQTIYFGHQGQIITLCNTHLTSPEFYFDNAYIKHNYKQLDQALKTHDIVVGDLNIDNLQLNDYIYNNLKETTCNHNSFLTSKYTKENMHQPDYIIVPTKYSITYKIEDCNHSDHYPVSAMINI